jgi:hypothetical protein
MSEDINHGRRRFLGTAAKTIGAAQLGMIGAVKAQAGNTGPAERSPSMPLSTTSFGPLKQVDAGVLSVGYAEVGPPMVHQ